MTLDAKLFDKTIPRPHGADICDICGGHAVCDAPTNVRPGGGPWGYLCATCFKAVGVPGIGFLFSDKDTP